MERQPSEIWRLAIFAMRVKFIERYNAWWPGATPELDPALAAVLIQRGHCTPFDAPDAQPAPQAEVVEPAPVDDAPAVEAPAPTVTPTKRGRRR